MADYRYKVGTFDRNLVTGSEVVSGIEDRCGPFTPKAVIVWTTSQAAEGATSVARFSMGISDGTTSQSCSNYLYDNLTDPGIFRDICYYSAGLLHISQNNLTVVADSAVLTGFSLGTFTIRWNANSGVPMNIHFLAIGGNDVSCTVGSFHAPAAPGAVTVTGLGIGQLTGLFLLPTYATNFLAQTNVAGIAVAEGPSIGWTDGTNQGACTMVDATNTTPNPNITTNATEQRTDKCLVSLTYTTGTHSRAHITSLDDSGFVVTYDTTHGTGNYGKAGAAYLAIAGPSVLCGATLDPATDSTVSLTTTFTPGAALFTSIGRTASTSVINGDTHFSFGAVDGAGQVGSWMGELEAVSTTVTSRADYTTNVITTATPISGGATQLSEAVATITETGVDLAWNTDGAARREVLWFAMEAGTSSIDGTSCTVETTPIPVPPPTTTAPVLRWFLHRFDAKPRGEQTS